MVVARRPRLAALLSIVSFAAWESAHLEPILDLVFGANLSVHDGHPRRFGIGPEYRNKSRIGDSQI